MINRLVIFGGTGDLTGRFLLPGLAQLHVAGHIDDSFHLMCASRHEWSDEELREWARAQLDRHAPDAPIPSRQAVVAAAHYRRGDAADAADVAAVVEGTDPVAVYLALPPAVFPAAIRALGRVTLPPGSMIVLEKPFGEDLESAVELNRLLAEVVPERSVFRVDHFLAMTTVQNVLGSRLANRVLEPIWNSSHIAEIDIVWNETVALEGRAGYYDGVGALKDMLQNHLLQLLCLVAMEPPVTLGERDLRDRKLDVLRSVRTLTEDDVVRRTRRARYSAGRIGGRAVPAYVDEEGVNLNLRTETYAQVDLELESWRWSGTRFRLRSGKAFGADHKEVVVRFRPVPHLPFGGGENVEPNVLRFALEPEGLSLDMSGVGGEAGILMPMTLTARMAAPDLPAYGHLLLEVLNEDTALSIRGDEAEEAWRVLTPVLQSWHVDHVPLEEYPAGSKDLPEPT